MPPRAPAEGYANNLKIENEIFSMRFFSSARLIEA
jgi:hypothetical protein